MSSMLPWDLTPALTHDRLVELARIAVATRNRAFAEADREAGDTNWGLGCKAHERLVHSLGQLAGDDQHPWLSVVRDGLYVMPLVNAVPVRLYCGSPTRPGSRNLDALRFEYERTGELSPRSPSPTRPREPASQMAFGFMVPPSEEEEPWYWLMAMETDLAGLVTRVVYFQANEAGETRHPWECPVDLGCGQPDTSAPRIQREPAQARPKRAHPGNTPGFETRQAVLW